QNPIRARCCGFGEKDRRLIDPPPIVQLTASRDGEDLELTPADTKLFVVHCSLYSADSNEERNLSLSSRQRQASSVYTDSNNNFISSSYSNSYGASEPQPVRNLIGSVVSSAYCLYNLENEKGVYSIFSDLSVRTEGTYTLRFIFFDLAAGEPMTMSTRVQAETFSKPFVVYTPKNFQGMTATTELSKCFSRQGVKIVTRK
ncbi:velvet factor, partial [Mycotypha africana]|uniref:velvet factor n=1 Tax=Mycotypha africana TaxID=64632 RepID=UPI002301A35A